LQFFSEDYKLINKYKKRIEIVLVFVGEFDLNFVTIFSFSEVFFLIDQVKINY
jgi:hypothetical protein